jgi:hypothetical protein
MASRGLMQHKSPLLPVGASEASAEIQRSALQRDVAWHNDEMLKEPQGVARKKEPPAHLDTSGEGLLELASGTSEFAADKALGEHDHPGEPGMMPEAFDCLVGGVLIELARGNHAHKPPEDEPVNIKRVARRDVEHVPEHTQRFQGFGLWGACSAGCNARTWEPTYLSANALKSTTSTQT